MKLLIAYATTDGQTRKIARFAADWLVDAGHTVELLNVDDCDGLVLTRFDRAILAGSRRKKARLSTHMAPRNTPIGRGCGWCWPIGLRRRSAAGA